MVAAQPLLSPRDSIHFISKQASRVRERYLMIPGDGDPEPASIPSPASFLDSSAFLLELCVLTAVFSEVATDLGIRTCADVHSRTIEFDKNVRVRLGNINPSGTIEKLKSLISQRKIRPPRPHDPATPGIATSVRMTRFIVSQCPIGLLDSLGRYVIGLEKLSHRCRVAHEFLVAFLRRNDPRVEAQIKTVGNAYSEGRLTVREIATIIDGTPSDAVMLMEKHGYCRSLDTVRLSQEERASVLQRIRDDRLLRRGTPDFSPEMAERDTIASERIEGVDARVWMLHKN